jgi:CheY-like chemotaxis protein
MAYRILVVDDNAPMRQIAVTMARSLGHVVLEADGPASALDLMGREAPVDLVLMDIVMPGGMSGIELADEMKRRGQTSQILFTSGFANMQQAGTITWTEKNLLTKPYRRADLSKRIDMLLGPDAT